MDKEIQQLIQITNKTFGSEKQAYAYLKNLVSRYNKKLFNNILPPVQISIVPKIEPIYNFGGAQYKSWHRIPQIFLHVEAINSKEKVNIIVVHELIHHWEYNVKTDKDSAIYPQKIDDLIKSSYSNKQERIWRAGHSKHFIAKSYEISSNLNVDIGQLLSGQMKRKNN